MARPLSLAAALAVLGATPLAAEPIFLSKQYPRCTNCHFSPTGGGLLTPYGRALSHVELSTFGSSGGAPGGREHEFLFGLLRDAPGPLSLGVELRPSHLDFDFENDALDHTRSFLMNAAVSAAARFDGWTVFAQLGRQPRGDDARVTSFEHWVGYRADGPLGVRAGRFLPAYGVKFADHTTFNRATLRLDNDDQIYGVELSYTGSRHLVQLAAGPGRADAVTGDDEEAALTAAGRWQFDVRPTVVLAASGLFRGEGEFASRNGATGLAVGYAPTPRLTLWGQADARFRSVAAGTGSAAYTVMGEAAFEVHRGVWVRFSPQLRTAFGDTSAGVRRLMLGVNALPRVHWNVVLALFHDRDRRSGRVTRTLLAQLHLYL